MRYLSVFMFLLFTAAASGQEAGLAINAQVDSLISMSRKLAEEKRFEEAIATLDALETVILKAFGKESVPYADCQFNKGRAYFMSGQYTKANFSYLEAVSYREKAQGRESKEFARYLNNLGVLNKELGKYDTAENYYREAKAIQKRVLGIESSDYAKVSNNLGVLYCLMGRFEAAENILIEVRNLREKSSQKSPLDYAASLNNLAALYYNLGRYEAAEPLYQHAKAIREKELGKDHSLYAGSLNNLGLLYCEMNQHEKAEPFFLEAKKIWGKVDQENLQYAEALHNLGQLYKLTRQYEKAESCHLEAKAIREKILGRRHPDYLVSLNNLAALYTQMGRLESAKPLYLDANASINELLANASKFLSGTELEAYIQLYKKNLECFYAFTWQSNKADTTLANSCYNNALFYKGLQLNINAYIDKLADADSSASSLNELLRAYRRRLAKEYARPKAQQQHTETLESLANSVEKELAQTVAGFGEAIRKTQWQDVQAALHPGEVAIEFIHFKYYNPNPTDSILYAALTLRYGDAAPEIVPLFEAKQLAKFLPQSNDMERIDEFYKTSTGHTIYDLVWKPLEPCLEGANKVFCAPSGLLYRLNLGAIPINKQSTFSDEHLLVVLGSTRQLAQGQKAPQNDDRSAVLFGGIQYDSSASTPYTLPTALNRGMNTDSPDESLWGGPKCWKYLPATLFEVENISGILWKNNIRAQVKTGMAATEEAFHTLGRDKPAPSILHLSTHGYFFPDPKDQATDKPLSIDNENLIFRVSEDPMIRSGLILAGANQAWVSHEPPANGEDGILTAYEISQQNLANTALVVLSACETGLGQIKGNEGIYGLQRAFKIAGAKYIIMSLWQVSDKATGELMVEFYRYYLEHKLPLPEAFRAAQQAMRNKYPDSPYAWAGFILVE